MLYPMGAIRRRADLSLEAFGEYWRTTHRDIVMEFVKPGPIEGYVQNHRIADLPAGMESDFDGVVELWIRDADAMAELGASERFQYAGNEDSAKFIDMPAMQFLLSGVDYETGKPRGEVAGMIRVIQYLKRPQGRESAAFDEAWLHQDTPLSMPDHMPARLARQTILPFDGEPHPSGLFGVESSWWPDVETLSQAWSKRISLDGSPVVFVREEVALEPPVG